MRVLHAAFKVSVAICLVGMIVALAPSQASAGWRRRSVVVTTSTVVNPDGTVSTVYTAPATAYYPTRVVYPAPVAEVFTVPTSTVTMPTSTVVSTPVQAVYTPSTIVTSEVVPTTYVAPTYVRRGLFGPRVVYPRTIYVNP